jgi:hypothetical protein
MQTYLRQQFHSGKVMFTQKKLHKHDSYYETIRFIIAKNKQTFDVRKS